jgi:glycosyltransferase involved in cell wall biosynthesis
MKILVSSFHFHPSIGGLEIASQTVADALAARGHDLTLVTDTPEGEDLDGRRRFAYPVVRRPGPARLAALVRDAELVWHNNVSLPHAWPLLAFRRPWVVTHQTWLRAGTGRLALGARLQRLALRGATQVAISRALAETLPRPATVIANPYRDDLFRTLPGAERDFDLGFAGRLVSDKGCDLLLDALAGLPAPVRLLVVGTGPEEPTLRARAERLGVASRVVFAGVHRDGALVAQLNRCRILVVPSRWAEPFGIVALEGLACGCVVVGSAAGGLPEAIGEAGATFPTGDAPALQRLLQELIAGPDRLAALRARAPAQLEIHRSASVADRYEALFRRVLGEQP